MVAYGCGQPTVYYGWAEVDCTTSNTPAPYYTRTEWLPVRNVCIEATNAPASGTILQPERKKPPAKLEPPTAESEPTRWTAAQPWLEVPVNDLAAKPAQQESTYG